VANGSGTFGSCAKISVVVPDQRNVPGHLGREVEPRHADDLRNLADHHHRLAEDDADLVGLGQRGDLAGGSGFQDGQARIRRGKEAGRCDEQKADEKSSLHAWNVALAGAFETTKTRTVIGITPSPLIR
jgi:hypothetical protein